MILTIPVVRDIEVEVDASEFLLDAWADAIPSAPDDEHCQPLRTLNSMAAWLKVLPVEAIAAMTTNQRSLIADFFDDQAQRFRPAKDSEP